MTVTPDMAKAALAVVQRDLAASGNAMLVLAGQKLRSPSAEVVASVQRAIEAALKAAPSAEAAPSSTARLL